MAKIPLENVRIASQEIIPSPRELGERYPLSDAIAETVAATRAQVQGILERRDPRLLVAEVRRRVHERLVDILLRRAALSAGVAP